MVRSVKIYSANYVENFSFLDVNLSKTLKFIGIKELLTMIKVLLSAKKKYMKIFN